MLSRLEMDARENMTDTLRSYYCFQIIFVSMSTLAAGEETNDYNFHLTLNLRCN